MSEELERSFGVTKNGEEVRELTLNSGVPARVQGSLTVNGTAVRPFPVGV